MGLREAVRARRRAGRAVGGLSGIGDRSGAAGEVDLRREFENPCSALKTLISRRSRGVFRSSHRSSGPAVRDARGRMVRSIGMTQTLLRPVQVDELVGLYEAGATLAELGRQFGVDRRTVAAHLVRRAVPIRQGGLDGSLVAEAGALYESGLTLLQIGMRFGVSQQAVRRYIAAEGVTIRPSARRPQSTRVAAEASESAKVKSHSIGISTGTWSVFATGV